MTMDVLNAKTCSIDEEKLASLQIKVVEMATSGVMITDAQAEGDPIIYVNDRFTQITGYESHEVIGRNCKFLQGKGTDPKAVNEMSDALKLFLRYEGEILNYKKDGSPFWNHVIMIPIFENGLVINHVAVIKDNTEKKHKNLQIKKVQENLQYLISKSNIVIYTCDFSTFQLTHLSENVQEEMGYSQNELLKCSMIDLARTNCAAILKKAYGNLVKKREFVIEHQFKHKRGDYIWVENRAKLITNEWDEPIEIIGYMENVTSRHREQALNKVNKSLESLVNSRTVELLIRSQELADYGKNLKRLHKISTQSFKSNAELIQTFLKVGCEIFNLGTGVVTRKGQEYFNIESYHSTLLELPSYSKFLAKGSRCLQSIKMHETIMSHNAQINLNIIHTDVEKLVIQTHLTTPIMVNNISYGTLSFFSPKAKKHSFNHYQVEMIEMMAQSIGTALAKEQAEEERRNVQGLYMTLAKNIPHSAVFIFDKNLKYLVAEGQILPEFYAKDITGKTIWDIMPEEEATELVPHYRAALLGSESSFENTHKDKVFLSHSLPIRNTDGEIYAGMILTIDITQRKQRARKIENLNHDLNKQVTLLEFANKELESFNYSVSHDLRAPLRSINGFSKILKEDHAENLDEESKRLINIIGYESQRMSKLIDDLLSFSKLRRTEQICSNFSLNILVDEVLAELSLRYENSDFKVVKNDLPDIYADRNMIKQVYINLINNAIKFSGKCKSPQIKISATRKENSHILSIQDNGVGFNEKYKEKLFGVFQRLHSYQEFEGTGVGLALVQRIVQRHRGEVWAEGKVDQGATFYFSIPKEN